MKTIKKILVASTVLPAMLLTQPGAGFAQNLPGALQMAQAQPNAAEEQKKKEEAKPPQHAPAAPAPRAPPAPHVAPAAPPQHVAPAAPHVAPATPHVAPPATPHVAPAAPPAPRAVPAHPAEQELKHPAAPPAPVKPVTPHTPETVKPQAPHAMQPVKPETPPAPGAGKPVPSAAPSPTLHGQRQAPGAPDQVHPAHGPQGQAGPGQGNHGQGTPGQGNPSQARPGQGAARPVGPKAAAVAAGLAGGVLAATAASNIAQIHHDRHETRNGGVDVIREPGRTIIGEGGQNFIVHDENERFHDLGLSLRSERHGDEFTSSYDRPDGSHIVTVTDAQGRLLRRFRRFSDGREYVLIDNGYEGQVRDYHDDIVDLPPVGAPDPQYYVDAGGADEDVLYEALTAPPVQPLPQRYTLDQVLYSPALRARMRSVDINTLTFDTGSWIVPPDQVGKLSVLADAINKAVTHNPNEVFLVEGFTDAVGNPTDNLSLSDRRAQSVAALLTREFKVPPENLTTQGYGQQYPKEQTSGPSRINRRVVVQRITPLLADTGQAVPR